MSSLKNVGLSIKELSKEFASQATTHGLRRISETERPLGKFIWAVIFVSALAGCSYHCSFLIQKYLNFGKVTTTEEIHAKQLQFPALTVCNLNILKREFLIAQLAINANESHQRKKGFCFESEESFLDKSEAKDLSDVWSNLGVTMDHLRRYGHQVYDLIVQCTYNANDCFNQSITEDLPLETENITITDYLSSRLGFCHTIKLNHSTFGIVRRTGQTLGLTLTLNIERDLYWDLLSPEFGVRILIHPREAFPTVDRGGIVLHPGTKTYLSIRIREIKRLPAPYGDCTKTFGDSPLSSLLSEWDDSYVTDHEYYTYEFCQTLCRESHLHRECNCVEEQINSTHRFCNPCNTEDEKCRNRFKKKFDNVEENACSYLCKPACEDTRYDVTSSTSEWPNLEFQEFLLKRWPELRSDFTEANTSDLNETFLNKNFLRVHIFVQEMNFLQFQDIEAYSLPELFADLGGCLGLYIGVSLISIIEFQEFLLHILALFYSKMNCGFYIDEPSESISRSKSMNELASKNLHSSRFEESLPPVFYIRAKKRTKFSGSGFKTTNIESLTDEETYSSKVCYKCLSDIQNVENGYLYRRKSPKGILKPSSNIDN